MSSEIQVETLAHQRKWAEDTARKNGWAISRVFEGVSTGKAGPRKLLRSVLLELRALPPAARPQWLLMIRLDRVGRGTIVETQLAVHELRELGVGVWTREDGEVKNASATEQLMVAMKAAVAAQENEVRKDKAAAVYRRKRAAGVAIGNKRPYGLTLGPDGHDAVVRGMAALIRKAFAMRAAGSGYHVIGRWLQDNAPPQTFKNGRTQTVRWTPGRVSRLLENRAYVTAGVIDDALFARAQQTRESLTRATIKPKHPWPLSGTLRCFCGRSMIGLRCGPKTRRIRYYGCRATFNHGGSSRLVRAEILEEAFLGLLKRLRSSRGTVERWKSQSASTASPKALDRSLKEAAARLADFDKQRDRVWSLHAAGHVRDEDVQQRLDAIAAKRAEAAQTVARLEQERALAGTAERAIKDARDLLSRAPGLFERAPVDGQQRIARSVAAMFGGLYVAESGEIERGLPEDPKRQRKRRDSET